MHSVLVLNIQIYLQLPDADAQVRLVESVGNVPSQRTVLLPLLNQSMEETHPVQQLLPHLHNTTYQK